MTYKTTAQLAQDRLLDWANDCADRTRVAEQQTREALAVAKGAINERDEALRGLAVLRMGPRRQNESQAAQGAVTASSQACNVCLECACASPASEVAHVRDGSDGTRKATP